MHSGSSPVPLSSGEPSLLSSAILELATDSGSTLLDRAERASDGHPKQRGEPVTTTFVMLAFEGPDGYARAGGLSVRVSELALALAETGHTVHLIFVGDPALPGQEALVDGRLVLHRWCQWISQYHPEGVYAGEEGKWHDFSDSAPPFVVDEILCPALAQGDRVVVLSEEWHTAEAICRINDRISQAGLRERAVLLWNANNTIGFERIDWQRLRASSTITTVSRYMKHLMWSYGIDPLVVPNGIPRRLLDSVDEISVGVVRRSLGEGPILLKVARWDPDKRWKLALEIIADLKALGQPARLVARGGVEAHGREVLDHAWNLGLQVRDMALHGPLPEAFRAAFTQADAADVLNITTPMSADALRVLYRAADGVLANSGREPFGLVGLETMAAGGTAYTGNTGEEYARHLENAVVLDTADPSEAAWYVNYLGKHPETQRRLRASARATARRFVWDRVIEQLLARVEVLRSPRGPGADVALARRDAS